MDQRDHPAPDRGSHPASRLTGFDTWPSGPIAAGHRPDGQRAERQSAPPGGAALLTAEPAATELVLRQMETFAEERSPAIGH
ncbi:MAG: hypothetical protein QOJ73_4697, partial [Streptosporangiaceae bacterium]|nr:hypothetical protein [Streptosporangiaceae bacterium]